MTAPHGRVRVAAHAKVNLALRVLAREESGFHQLETDFHRLALHDDVVVATRPGTGVSLRADVDFGVAAERNLAVRAAHAYAAAAPWAAGVHVAIEIVKRIPMGGGLGGGSADAGAVLRALDALAPAPLGPDALVALATPLGADVPFLASEAPRVLAWGRGERMLALPALAGATVHLACFDAGVETAAAYDWLAAARAAAPEAPRAVRHDVAALATLAGVRAVATNAFEAPVAARRPDVAGVLSDWRAALAEDASIVLLSGSGATVFAVVAGDDAAREATLAAAAARHGAQHVRTALLDRVAAPGRVA